MSARPTGAPARGRHAEAASPWFGDSAAFAGRRRADAAARLGTAGSARSREPLRRTQSDANSLVWRLRRRAQRDDTGHYSTWHQRPHTISEPPHHHLHGRRVRRDRHSSVNVVGSSGRHASGGATAMPAHDLSQVRQDQDLSAAADTQGVCAPGRCVRPHTTPPRSPSVLMRRELSPRDDTRGRRHRLRAVGVIMSRHDRQASMHKL